MIEASGNRFGVRFRWLHWWRLLLSGALLCGAVLCGCTASPERFDVKSLAKTDIDLVADVHRSATQALLQQLHQKLYLRNPRQLHRAPGESIETRWQQVSKLALADHGAAELGGVRSIEAMRLAFDEGFQGDRVFALMVGLATMLSEAYGYKQEFYWMDNLDQQALYNSARNIEVMVWLLRTSKGPAGAPLILTDSVIEGGVNLSFERLFGKLIAHQDALSEVMQGKTQRAVNRVAHGLVSMTFLPL